MTQDDVRAKARKPASIEMLSKMLDTDIERSGPMESFMIRAGLLREILDELEAHRLAFAPRQGDRDQLARAMYDAWPHTVLSKALAEVTGLPAGATLTWEVAEQAGADFSGLYRYADAVLAFQSTLPTVSQTGEG